MARLALTVAGGVLGAILIPGVGASLGFAIGSALGGIIGQLAFPGRGTHVYGPRLNDLQISTSAPGQVIPLLFGYMRLGGQIIWSTGLQETTVNQNQSAKGGPSVTQTSYTYTVSFATSFCQGPGSITRIWGDAKLIYDSGGSSNPSRGTWSDTTQYNVNDIVTFGTATNPANGQKFSPTYICMVSPPIGVSPNNGNFWAQDDAVTNVNTNAPTYPHPTLYPGDENQLPDPLISSTEGATVTPAYRGLVYAVWEDFPLQDFGNRLPNIRAEVTSNPAPAFPLTPIPWAANPTEPEFVIVDPLYNTAFAFVGGTSEATAQIMRVDLSTSTVVASGSIDMTGLTGWGNPADAVACNAGIATVDNQGYIWGRAVVGGKPGIVKIDPWTFKALLFTDFNHSASTAVCNDILSLAMYVAIDGSSYVVGFGTQSFASSEASVGYLMFSVCAVPPPPPTVPNPSPIPPLTFVSGQIVGMFYAVIPTGGLTPGLSPGDTSISLLPLQVYPVIDKQNGYAYFIYGLQHQPSGSTGDWCIAKINLNPQTTTIFPTTEFPTGPLFMDTQLFVFPANASVDVGIAMFWDAVNNALVVLTNAGAFLQISATNGQVLDTVGSVTNPQFNVASGNITGSFLRFGFAQNLVQAAFNGLVQNGVIWVPDVTNPAHLVNIINTAAFTKVASFDIANFPGAPSGGSNWPGNSGNNTGAYIYDPAGNTLVSLSNSQFGSGPTWALYRAFLDRINVQGLTADVIVRTICELASIPDANVDVSRLSGIAVEGYPVSSLTAGKDMINTLGQAYFFEGRESDFKLVFIPRGQTPALNNVAETDLGLLTDSAELTEEIGQAQDLPKDVEILYIDPRVNYQQGQQKRVRHSRTRRTINHTSISLPLVMTSVQAAQLADKIMWTAENERRHYTTNFWKALYMLLDPCDVITFNYHGLLLTARLTDSTIGQNFAVAAKFTNEDANTYTSAATGNNSTGFTGQTISGLALSLLFMLDIPYLQDQDADAVGNIGYYFAMDPASGGAWPAGVLYTSSDNATFTQVNSTAIKATYGIAQAPLGLPPDGVFTWDFTNKLTLRVLQGSTPTSTTMLNVLNGANAAILYPSLEVIQFTTVVDNADGTITLSGLLRGRRGTDDFIGNHTYGETVIFPLAGGVVHQQVTLSLLNLLRYYKPITVGADLNSNPQSQPIKLQGRDLMPYAPAAFYSQPSGSDILFTWFRRTRLGGALQDGTGTVPLSEDNEQYSIDIINGSGVVKRTFNGIIPPGGITDSWTSPAQPHQLYTAAQQATDGYTPGAGWTAVCYQISGEVGRGFATPVKLP